MSRNNKNAVFHTALPSGSIVIKAGQPRSSTFIANHPDPLHTEKVKGKLRVRKFAKLNGREVSLLCTLKKPAAAYSIKYAFTALRSMPAVLWAFEQGRAWASPFTWRVDRGPWTPVDNSARMYDVKRLAGDGPLFTWSRLGNAPRLNAGRHLLEIRVTAPKGNGQYLLSQDRLVFFPAGREPERKPFQYLKEPGPNAILLWQGIPAGSPLHEDNTPWLEPFLLKGGKSRGAVIVCPGGAYIGHAAHEAGPIARRFNAMGYHAFVLYYRLLPHRYPAQILDIARAVRLVRKNAAVWHIAPNQIAVCGFSAGGHLSATIGVHYTRVPRSGNQALDRISCRPNALILCYAALSAFGNYDVTATGRRSLVPAGAPLARRKLLSVDLYVDKNTPPAFIWHCYDDDVVGIDHALVFSRALRDHAVPHEMHLYPRGGHGLGLAPRHPSVATWPGLCRLWLRELGFIHK
jgi:acetyl esterase/lipase